MTERPIFVPAPESADLVKEIFFPLKWHSGFAPSQKEKNIVALHAAAAAKGFTPLLEISTKSEKQRGKHLSAFYMKVQSQRFGKIFLECAFQGSKVFERGGPFIDLYTTDVRQAKRDRRLKESGPLKGFEFDGFSWPLEPKTAFYDWLYISFLYDYRDWATKLYAYAGFTDIEFNPHRSINCQARSCALFITLMKKGLLDTALRSPLDFVNLLLSSKYRPQLRAHDLEADCLFSPPR